MPLKLLLVKSNTHGEVCKLGLLLLSEWRSRLYFSTSLRIVYRYYDLSEEVVSFMIMTFHLICIETRGDKKTIFYKKKEKRKKVDDLCLLASQFGRHYPGSRRHKYDL